MTKGVVHFFGEDEALTSLPVMWTDAVNPDVFVAIAAGRSPFRVGAPGSGRAAYQHAQG